MDTALETIHNFLKMSIMIMLTYFSRIIDDNGVKMSL